MNILQGEFHRGEGGEVGKGPAAFVLHQVNLALAFALDDLCGAVQCS
jgi:hypothetical protein